MVSRDMVELPRAAPGPERARLGFADAAQAEFGFLLRLGFRLVELTDTICRYQSDRRLVRVFHGRGSYELGVEIGRWIEVGGQPREQAFPLPDVVTQLAGSAASEQQGTAATTAEAVSRVLRRLADQTREIAGEMLTGGDDLFDRLSAANAARGQAEQDQLRAQHLRERADDAWRRKDFDAVITAYTEIDREMDTVELRTSERRRLDYALRSTGRSR
jgi:hypothetical protein